MASNYIDLPVGNGVVSLNGLNGALTLVAGANITITTGTNTITIAGVPGAGITIGALDSQPANAAGLTLVGSSLSTQSADATHPGMVNNTTQSFSGNKTFTGTIGASNLSGTNTGDVTIGTGNGLSLAGQVLSLQLSSTTLTGALSSTDWNTFNNKQAAGNYITALTTDVVASGPGSVVATIQPNVVSNSKLAQMPTLTIKGNNTGGTANALDLTVAQVNTMLGDILANGTVAFAADQSLGSHKLTNVTDPVAAQDAATKAYVDASVAALNPATSVYAASTTNIVGTYLNGAGGIGATFVVTATGAFTIDGVTPPVNSRILIKNQSSGFQNGIYDLTVAGSIGVSPVLTRSLDYNTAADMNAAGLIPVINGTVNALSSWQQTAVITTVGTDALVFQEFTANPSLYMLKANNLNDVANANTSFNNISPMTTLGDTIYGGASGVGTRRAIGSTGNVLTVSGGIPVWAAPATSGTVTSVALTMPSIFSVAGSPITSSGTLAVTLATETANTVFSGPASGGAATPTFRSLVVADIPALPYASSTLTNTHIFVGNGSNVATDVAASGDLTLANTGAFTLNTVNGNVGSFGSSTAIPSFTVNAKGLVTAASTNVVIAPAGTLTGTTLASNVVSSSLTSVGTITSGTWNGTTIAIANGGTGQTTANPAFNALSPLTTKGDIVGYSTVNARIPIGSDGQVLTADSAQTLGLKWATPTTGTVTSVALTVPSFLSVSGSPITSSGTLAITLATETANTVFAGPTSGGAATPTFRALVAADIPALPYASSTLTNTHIFVGNGSNVATDVAASGDLTLANTGAFTLNTVNSNVGSFGSSTAIPSFTVNAKGLVTAASTNVVIAPAGTLTGTTLAANVVSSSLTSVGTIATGVWNGTTIAIANGGTGQTTANPAFNALSPLTTKGDIVGYSTVNARIPIGSDGQVLTADSAQTLGLKWATPTTGTVTSVALTVPTFLSVSGSPITSSGTLAVSLSGTALPVANGGTGLTSGTSGGILGYTASGTLASSAALTVSQLIIGGGAGATPSTLAAGSQYQVLRMGAATPAYGSINLDQSAAVTGTLPVGNGGTGVTSVTIAPTATAFAGWDANKNISANSVLQGYATTATAAGTTTLVVGSAEQQFFTGSTTQTVTLPATSTLALGQQYAINNLSSGVVTVQTSGSNTIQAMAANSRLTLTVILTSGTGTASWSWTYGLLMSTGVLPIANGGTGQTTAAAAFNALSPMTTGGDVIYGGASGAGTRLANGTAGQTLTSAGGTSAPTWSNEPVILANGLNTTFGSSATVYAPLIGPSSVASTTENDTKFPMPVAGTIKNLYVKTSTAQPASGSLVFTIRKNNADTTVTVTVAANGAAQTVSDTTHSFTFVAGDFLALRIVNNATGTTANILGWSMQLLP